MPVSHAHIPVLVGGKILRYMRYVIRYTCVPDAATASRTKAHLSLKALGHFQTSSFKILQTLQVACLGVSRLALLSCVPEAMVSGFLDSLQIEAGRILVLIKTLGPEPTLSSQSLIQSGTSSRALQGQGQTTGCSSSRQGVWTFGLQHNPNSKESV